MTTFLQFHILTSFGPSNPNRDDQGKPKQAKIGGSNRLRMSSQSLKRALRESTFFALDLRGNMGTRTKRLTDALRARAVTNGMDETVAHDIAMRVATIFGKMEKVKNKVTNVEEDKNTTLAFLSPDEMTLVENVFDRLAMGEALSDADLKKLVLRKADGAVDIAMFGRMLAEDSGFNRDAAVQVSHAFTTHATLAEVDWYTAMDDLSIESNSGAAHLDESEFGSGLYYLYVCVNCDLLIKNLGGDRDLAVKAIEALTKALPQTAAKGKQNSFAHHPLASYMLVESGTGAPHNLDVAFFNPVKETPLLVNSIMSLKDTRDAFNKTYGTRASKTMEMIVGGDVTLADVVTFTSAEVRGA